MHTGPLLHPALGDSLQPSLEEGNRINREHRVAAGAACVEMRRRVVFIVKIDLNPEELADFRHVHGGSVSPQCISERICDG